MSTLFREYFISDILLNPLLFDRFVAHCIISPTKHRNMCEKKKDTDLQHNGETAARLLFSLTLSPSFYLSLSTSHKLFRKQIKSSRPGEMCADFYRIYLLDCESQSDRGIGFVHPDVGTDPYRHGRSVVGLVPMVAQGCRVAP